MSEQRISREQVIEAAREYERGTLEYHMATRLLAADDALKDIAEGNNVPDDKLEMQPAAFHKWFGGFLQAQARAAMLPREEKVA